MIYPDTSTWYLEQCVIYKQCLLFCGFKHHTKKKKNFVSADAGTRNYTAYTASKMKTTNRRGKRVSSLNLVKNCIRNGLVRYICPILQIPIFCRSSREIP